jgi:sugar phosphate isomerase/epimerase
MIRFGGPVFLQKDAEGAGAGESHGVSDADPEEVVRAHQKKCWRAAYSPDISVNDSDLIKAYRDAFEAADIMIAEVGYWDNLIDIEPETRSENRQKMLDAMILAEELGAQCAVDILGSYCHGNGNSAHAAKNFSAEAFDEAVEMARYFIDEVNPKQARFTYEIFPFNVIDSPREIARLIKAVDRQMFGVHLDLANLINCPRAYWNSGAVMRECIELFGDKIVTAHAKDIKLQEPAITVMLEEVIAGTGYLDIGSYVKELHKLPQEVPLMLEHLSTEAEYDQAAAYYRKAAQTEGIKI